MPLDQSCIPTTQKHLYICERIWEKGPLHAEDEFLFLIEHNFKAVIATGFKPGIANLQSLNYTHCKISHPAHFWFGLTEVQSTDAATLDSTIKDTLIRVSLPMSHLCGQAYDGASNMAGHLTGVATSKMTNQKHSLFIA